MKEFHSKILDNFIAKNHGKSRRRFAYTLFQDVCRRLLVDSAYSRFLNHRHPLSGHPIDKKEGESK
ncbi:MAG TPA: hypothetical protein VK791_02345 [bacterium]|jgi:hypothetical protein|nr:hypothetical protein [bacterium]